MEREMAVARYIKESMSKSSFIRQMFEMGIQLKKIHGDANVFDFTIGNPNLDPPPAFNAALAEVVNITGPMKHGYMPNAGYVDVRAAIAEYVSKQNGVALNENHIIMTCGAGGALNCILKTLLNPGDTVIGCAPYFVEYNFYAENHGGRFVAVDSKPDFDLDIDALANAITAQTAAVLINSPNNPTGRIYPESTLKALGRMLASKSTAIGRVIYLISDEPYRTITYDNAIVPSVFQAYTNSIIAMSYSKDLSIPGERIGWIAIHSAAADADDFINGAVLCNRILGYVNAPALMQRVVKKLQGISCDMSLYITNRNLLCSSLTRMGYELVKPDGAFYLFPKAPGGNDKAFVDALREELILAVPGSGFGKPGYFRLAFCCATKTIEGALPGFERALRRYK
jgi:aspartate aminotransferase